MTMLLWVGPDHVVTTIPAMTMISVWFLRTTYSYAEHN